MSAPGLPYREEEEKKKKNNPALRLPFTIARVGMKKKNQQNAIRGKKGEGKKKLVA